LLGAARVFLVEEMECGKTNVSHFLFAKNEALVGQSIVGLRDVSSRHRGCGCAARQRKTKSGRAERRKGGGFGCLFLLRSLLIPWHGRILQKGL